MVMHIQSIQIFQVIYFFAFTYLNEYELMQLNSSERIGPIPFKHFCAQITFELLYLLSIYFLSRVYKKAKLKHKTDRL